MHIHKRYIYSGPVYGYIELINFRSCVTRCFHIQLAMLLMVDAYMMHTEPWMYKDKCHASTVLYPRLQRIFGEILVSTATVDLSDILTLHILPFLVEKPHQESFDHLRRKLSMS